MHNTHCKKRIDNELPRLPPSRQSVHGPKRRVIRIVRPSERTHSAIPITTPESAKRVDLHRSVRKVHFDATAEAPPPRRPTTTLDSKTIHPRLLQERGAIAPTREAPPIDSRNRYAVLDSGTTSHFVPENFRGARPAPLQPGSGPDVSCPNGTEMPSVGTDELLLADLPPKARECYVLKNLQLPLMSVKQLCFYGMRVIFYRDKVNVYDKHN